MLRAFATGAGIQHFTKTLARVPGVGFRLPTGEELDALENIRSGIELLESVALLENARRFARGARRALFTRAYWLQQAATAPKQAQAALVE